MLPDVVSEDQICIFDVETDGLDWWKDNLIGVGIMLIPTHQTFFIPDWSRERWNQWFRDNTHLTFIGHNLKFDLHFMHIHPETVWRLKLWDTMIMAHHYDSRLSKSLESLEQTLLGKQSKKDILDSHSRKRIHKWDIQAIAEYCLNDVRVTWELYKLLDDILHHPPYYFPLLEKDMQFLKFIYEMEYYGVRVDVEGLQAAIPELEKERAELEKELYKATGHEHSPFNWRSHQQLSKVLYDEMNFPRPVNPFIDPVTGIDMGRNPSSRRYNSTMVSTAILAEKAQHPLAALIMKLRETDKLQKSIENLLNLQHNGYIHSNFNLAGTRTGRLSSSRPNLQNLSGEYRVFFFSHAHTGELTAEEIERKDIFNVRRYVVPSPGNIFVSIDYKQMEMRMFGVVSQDPHMLEFLQSGVDIHAQIAARVWGQATEATRDWAKQISFGLIYGMTMGSLRFRLNLSLEEARKITSDYWTAFPTIRPWLFGVVEECKRTGYLRYWSGRLWMEDDVSKMYKGANALIQGGCADLLSVAVLRLYRFIKQNNLPIRIVNLIHDEVLMEMPEECLSYVNQIKEILEVKDIFGIPFVTDVKVGDAYGHLRPLESKSSDTNKHIFSQ